MPHDSSMKFVNGFPIYGDKQLAKVNALRKVLSTAGNESMVALERSQVAFSTAESAHDEPRSCLNCPMFFSDAHRCKLFGDRVKIAKFTEGKPEGKLIEFWPVCDYWMYGTPEGGEFESLEYPLDPDDAGLSWINAPRVGAKHSGTCCGGANDGDDCDMWLATDKENKMESHTGFCRVLQTITANMDCCSSWTDDDLVDWRTAQQWLKETA